MNKTKKLKLLFIGNSHTYYNSMPYMVKQLFEAVGLSTHVTMLCEGGKGLIYHCDRKDTKFNIRYGDYDFVMLQDKATDFNADDFLTGGKKIAEESLIHTAAKPVLYMIWARRAEVENQVNITTAHKKLASEIGADIAPAGEVWHKILREHPETELYREDGNHATPLGSYLAAVTIFYTISGRVRPISPKDDDEPHTRLGIDREMRELIHREACAMVNKFRREGKSTQDA